MDHTRHYTALVQQLSRHSDHVRPIALAGKHSRTKLILWIQHLENWQLTTRTLNGRFQQVPSMVRCTL